MAILRQAVKPDAFVRAVSDAPCETAREPVAVAQDVISPHRSCPRFLLACLLISVLDVVIFSPGMRGDFHYDDLPFVVRNAHIRSLQNIPDFFRDRTTLSASGHHIYRPLRTTSYAADFVFWRLNPVGYHLVNMILHAVNGILVLAILMRLLDGDWIFSLGLAVLFLVHPVQTETVNWISCRGDLLVAFFTLACMLVFMRMTGPAGQVLSLLLFAMGLLSKEVAVVAPVMLLMLERHLRGGWCLRRVWPYGVITLLYLVVRFHVLGEVKQREYWGGGFWQCQSIMTHAWQRYLTLICWPSDLRVIYVFPHEFSPVRLWVCLVLFVMTGATGIVCHRCGGRWRLAALGIAWCGVFLLPVANLIPFKGLLTEHFLYLPIVGVLLVLACFLQGFIRTVHGRMPACLLLGMLIPCGVMSLQRSRVWADTLSLWQDTRDKSDAHPVVWSVLGLQYKRRHEMQHAYTCFKTSLALDPNYEASQFQLGFAAYMLGKYDEALVAARPFYEAHRDSPAAGILLGRILAARGSVRQAVEVLRATADRHPGHIVVQGDLANCLADSEKWREAVLHYEKVLVLNPQSPDAHRGLGRCWLHLQCYEDAERAFRRALALDPDSLASKQGLVTSLIRQRKMDQAKTLVDELRGRGVKIPPAILEHFKVPP